MKSITYANTVDKFEKQVSALRESRLYKDKPNVENYIINTGLSCKVRWAQAFRKQQETNIVNTNNGTEAQNKLFKYEYLPRSVDKSVYGIAAILVESFIPDSHGRYLVKNLKFSDEYGRYNSRIPTYLHNRPPQFVKHCLDSRFAAGEFTEADISSELVDFSYPSCTCASWQKKSEEKSAEAEYLEKSDIELPNNSPNGTTTTSTVEKLRKWFLDKIDTFKNTTYLVDDETTMSTALKQLKNIQLMLHKSCSSTHGIPFRISPVKEKLKITSTEYHQVFHKKFPLRRRWKKKTLKADLNFIEEDSNDDVDDDAAKRKATNFFVVDLTASGDGEQKTVSQDDEANSTCLDLERLRNGSAKLPVKQLKGKPTARLLRASKMGLKMTDMFHDGPAKLTVSDTWMLIHPEVAKKNIKFNRTIA
ncbi:unnamed protein product, partial [Pocillopora meandrina]